MRNFCAGLCLIASVIVGSGCATYHSAPGGGEGRGLPMGVGHGTLIGDVTYPCFVNSETIVQLDTDDFEIVQTVTAESSSTNILGIVGTGDNGYGKLFEKARSAGADDVINIKADTRTQSFLRVFYTRATTKLTGTAIRWKKK